MLCPVRPSTVAESCGRVPAVGIVAAVFCKQEPLSDRHASRDKPDHCVRSPLCTIHCAPKKTTDRESTP